MSTYEKILESADTLIQQSGFQGFSYSDIEKVVNIRKASIHHHFPSKVDLGIAYCKFKTDKFNSFNASLNNISSGLAQFKCYLKLFSLCAKKGEMCGVYAMLSDSYQLPAILQDAIDQLVNTELSILENILTLAKKQNEINLNEVTSRQLSIIICTALKGSLMLNRIAPHNAYDNTVKALITMVSITK